MTKPIFHSRFLMCRPEYFSINYSINPWMKLENDADWKLAQKQWKHLHHLLIRLGGYVEYVTPHHGLPDMCFAANSAVVKGNRAVISKFKHEERSGEEFFWKRWFDINGFETLVIDVSMEGAGDYLFDSDGGFYTGYGFRSVYSAWNLTAPFLGVKASDIYFCELKDDRFYHLDTCFCPLSLTKKNLIYFSKAINCSISNWLDNFDDVFDVPEQEAIQFACNAVQVGDSVVLPSGCPETESKLREWGFDVYSCDMSEFIKSGGACKCLTLNLGDYDGHPHNSPCPEHV